MAKRKAKKARPTNRGRAAASKASSRRSSKRSTAPPVRASGGRSSKSIKSWKPGSEPEKARNVAAEGDFGVPMGSARNRDRDYVTQNTKRSDRGHTRPASHEHDGVRTSGAGADYSGPGSASGGDIDTDITGVGFGGSGVAQSTPGRPPGPDDSDGTSNEFNSPVPHTRGAQVQVIPAQRRNQGGVGKIGGTKRIRGSLQTRDRDVSTAGDAQGADAATNPHARGDDSFIGEVSTGEASGNDLSISPSQETQGVRRGDNQMRGTQKDVRGQDDQSDEADIEREDDEA